MRLLAGDIGGTKTLLRLVEHDGGVSLEGRYDTGAYVRFDDLLRAFVREAPGAIDAACFAVAGPVRDGYAELTNRGWVIERDVLASQFPLGRVAVINDFSAIALAVPLLPRHDLIALQAGVRDPRAPIAILGAGTGLGEAIVVTHDDVHYVIPTEGGHGDFAPQDEEQARLFLHMHARLGHVSWERVLSGMGLENIFEFLGGGECSPAEIAELAAAGHPIASRTMEIFIDAYGAEAGNMGLRVLARGGVYLAGGIAAKNVPWFTDGRFVEAFRRKGRFRELMETIPVDLIANEEVGVIGATEGARRAALT